jgi:SpoVK/Ycf46/Vps4 family AAA+-type ATPase
VEECARRLERVRRLTGDPILIDLVSWDYAGVDDGIRLFLKTLGDRGGTSALIGSEQARVVRLIGSTPFELIADDPLPIDALAAAVKTAAHAADLYLTTDGAEAMARRFPLHLDGLEHAMSLARSRPKDSDANDPELERFTAACKEVVSDGISQLADLIEPVFDLDDVVLPADRKEQLVEIVDNIRLAPRVLDDWKFRHQLPYGRGVTALFFGPSGTGKTMAAIGIASRLGIQLLRFDLSRVVSKYIGDTEKNIDRVFTDAQRSGSAILIDEADALLGKRSEVKDAHDRYANIEVAYLLQRMEAYEGLAILTTNMRQNLDPAFLRRLRFIVDFPRPDAEARETIWRQCLPALSHTLDDRAFRQLARRIDLTGGHIRQITLRAAFIAAAAGTTIALEHIAHAARAEFTKLGMPSVDLDVGPGRQAA